MVEPERENPGISAKTCAMPTVMASPDLIVSRSRFCLPTISATISRRATKMTPKVMTRRSLVNGPSMMRLSASPSMATGSVPMMTSQPSHALCLSAFVMGRFLSMPRLAVTKPRMMLMMSLQK